jgi:predicted small lipoprotein YifL
MKPATRCRPCRLFIALIFFAGVLAACGQYGDLYLPPEQTPQKKEQPAGSDSRQDEDAPQVEE